MKEERIAYKLPLTITEKLEIEWLIGSRIAEKDISTCWAYDCFLFNNK